MSSCEKSEHYNQFKSKLGKLIQLNINTVLLFIK